MTDELALEQLLDARTGVPPVDDTPASTDAGDTPATDDDIDEED